MLTFYINRAGKSLPASRKRNLVRATDELRKVRQGMIPMRRRACRLSRVDMGAH